MTPQRTTRFKLAGLIANFVAQMKPENQSKIPCEV